MIRCDGPGEHLEDHADHDEHDAQHRQDPDGDGVHKEGEGASLGILGAGHGDLPPVLHYEETIPEREAELK